MNHRSCTALWLISTLALASCGDDDASSSSGAGASGGTESTTGATPSSGSGSTSTGGDGDGDGGAGGGSAESTGSGPGGGGGQVFPGGDCPDDLGLPAAATLPGVRAVVRGGVARIYFDPIADARDYRVYVLPAAEDVDGSVNRDAVYRCAGGSAVPTPGVEDANPPEYPGVRTRVESTVVGYPRTADDATLGWVFHGPGEGRVPVYALGHPAMDSDNVDCYQMRWPESRYKRLVTSEAERDQLLSERWRDDGIVFYAAAPGSDGTHDVVTNEETGEGPALYLAPGAELEQRRQDGGTFSPAFSVWSDEVEGAVPLMRVHYDHACARSHDELVAGESRFEKAYRQGYQPIEELHFAGIAEGTTLVVEALDAMCPFQGLLSPQSRPARVDELNGYTVDYAAFVTPDELRAASATGEVYVNGQGPEDTQPTASARACIEVEPVALPEMDFRYGGEPEALSEATNPSFQQFDMATETFDVSFLSVATDEWAFGGMMGELWTTYADWAADTGGKLRATPKQRATLDGETFLHATMEVDAVSSDRRYPQMLISDAEWPVQANLPTSHTVVIQTRGGVGGPTLGEIQFCDEYDWDVNHQCPSYDLYRLRDGDADFLSPQHEVNGLTGVDRTVVFDAYVSSERVYLFLNGSPHGCADLPAGRLPAGPATVTFGDVLYHSGVDLAEWYPFQVERMHVTTTRHFANLGFSSGVEAPSWDESRFPCVPADELPAQEE